MQSPVARLRSDFPITKARPFLRGPGPRGAGRRRAADHPSLSADPWRPWLAPWWLMARAGGACAGRAARRPKRPCGWPWGGRLTRRRFPDSISRSGAKSAFPRCGNAVRRPATCYGPGADITAARQVSVVPAYSISSSTRSKIDGGTARPSGAISVLGKKLIVALPLPPRAESGLLPR
jgi:hypothetical protein